MVYVVGSVSLETAAASHFGPLPAEGTTIAARRPMLAATPAGTYPRTAAAADVIATWMGTEQYLWGLRRVLNGLAGSELQ
jgi:hypothetical protein